MRKLLTTLVFGTVCFFAGTTETSRKYFHKAGVYCDQKVNNYLSNPKTWEFVDGIVEKAKQHCIEDKVIKENKKQERR
ncbi:MAG: hypothetical protein Q8N88_05325 [Nanoarchaeota archaeon]|nr:hypothetical protein [Nanoarchaeota archaeon]